MNIVISDVRLQYEWKYFFDGGFIPVHLNVSDDIREIRLKSRDGEIHPNLFSDITERDRNVLPGWVIHNTDMLSMRVQIDLMVESLTSNVEYSRIRRGLQVAFRCWFENVK